MTQFSVYLQHTTELGCVAVGNRCCPLGVDHQSLLIELLDFLLVEWRIGIVVWVVIV